MSDRKPVIIVTGASKGIGLAVTRLLLHKFNANVVALARTATEELNALSSNSLLFVGCDVANESALANAITSARETFQYIDGLVFSAATLDPLCRIDDSTPLSAWKSHFDVNFFSLVTALKAVLPALRESELGGRVVFVSSGAAVKGTPGWGPYNASKAAMNSFCRTLAEEERDIVSVSVRPGMVNTDMQVKLRAEGKTHMTQAGYETFVRAHAENKLVKPEDCGHVIAALAVKAPKKFSGQFVSWDSEDCKPFRKEQD
ncbi:hypothetical protein AX15_007595 [Amanita polypyramis BW_CC]|nr:hypothetical protein AX15_007595 [Amanita polypyramis BW_CC]